MGRLFAIGDIHGCFETFYELVINKIGLDRSDRLVLLGDYIDRGEKSKEVVDFIMDLMNMGFDITPLSGNHEALLTDAWKNPAMLPIWLLNSGMTTLQSFGIQDINDIDEKYMAFFLKLNYYKAEGNFIFVHAGFNDFAPDPFSDRHGMIWECRSSYENPLLRNKTIVHGHKPKKIAFIEKLLRENSSVIPVDTGCVYGKESGYGNLSALEIGTMKLITVENSYS